MSQTLFKDIELDKDMARLRALLQLVGLIVGWIDGSDEILKHQ